MAMRPAPLLPGLILGLLAACRSDSPPPVPVTPAVLVPGQSPIPYPPELYSHKVEGEVLLYLFVDSSGAVVRDSIRVAKSSGQAAFDAAALAAAPTLRFTPAHRGDLPVAAPIQVPIQFTLPDSVKNRQEAP
jgi:TonB family protein